jgi:hypothetical protein
MSIEAGTTSDERRKYLRKMQEWYRPAGRRERGLVDEMTAITGLHRKRLIRQMNSNLERRAQLELRGRTHGPDVNDALRVIAESMDYICAARLTPNLVWQAEQWASQGELDTIPQWVKQLGQISPSSAKRWWRASHRQRQGEPAHVPRKGPRDRRRRIHDETTDCVSSDGLLDTHG